MQPLTPILIIIFGLPGTGKTSFATQLSDRLSIASYNTDKLRVRLGRTGQYSEKDKGWIYDELVKQVRTELKAGNSVIVDGTFYKESLRGKFKELAKECKVPVKWIEIYAREAVVKERISKTRPFSEADFSVYKKVKTDFDNLKEKHICLHSDREPIKEMIRKALDYINA